MHRILKRILAPAQSHTRVSACHSLSRQVTLETTSASGHSKPFYITTPIFYVNAKPHVGHLYTMLLCDVIKRYRIFAGHKAILLTGTDEHGMKIQNAAHQARLKPQEFCDQVSQVFRELPAKANIQYDHFIRTTSAEHKNAVTAFWHKLEAGGHIYKSEHEGWYSVSDETFFPPSAITRVSSEGTDEAEFVSTETGNVVTWTKEENYHFRLSAFKDKLLEFYETNNNFIIPQARFDDVVQSVSAGLSDLSISRPSTRLKWGIRVPNDESQTIYVWLDALVNYITAAGYPEPMELWPADLHVIGKDIVRFHCIYWPAFLMAAGLELPKKVLTHSHWTMENFKMSKSRGNVADPWYAIERFGIDSVRYYLMRDGRLENDGNYSTDNLISSHNHDLVNSLGNLVARATSKSFDLDKIFVDPPSVPTCSSTVRELHEQIKFTVQKYHQTMSEHAIYKAISHVMTMLFKANALMQKEEPWSETCEQGRKAEVLYFCIESARIAALLWQPIMPDSMARLLDRLGVAADRRSVQFAQFGADDSYRPLQARGGHLFVPIVDGKTLTAKTPKGRFFQTLSA